VNEIKFVHPKDMQDGKIEITERDITTNLPYVPGAYLAFDHHFPKPCATSSMPITSSTRPRLLPRAWCTTTSVASRLFRASATK
jgi:hypothetical protein